MSTFEIRINNMTKKDYINEMFSLQRTLNDNTNGLGRETGSTKDDGSINCKR